MIKIIAFILLIAPGLAGAGTVAGGEAQSARTEAVKKTGVYRTIAGELLKNCEGAEM